jgi:hypothetical protein
MEVQTMRPEEQRIAIAKACGWTDIGFARFGGTGLDPLDGLRGDLPDYLNDLNAMHEAEKLLLENSGTWTRYVTELKIQSAKFGMPLFHLNATQRAEAFLKTLNLWIE